MLGGETMRQEKSSFVAATWANFDESRSGFTVRDWTWVIISSGSPKRSCLSILKVVVEVERGKWIGT